MFRQQLNKALPLALIIWIGFAVIAAYFGAEIVLLAKPAVEFLTVQMDYEFITTMSAAPPHSELGTLAMRYHLIVPLQLVGSFMLAPGTDFDASIPAGQDLLPPMLALSILLAWPYSGARQRFFAVAFGVCATTLLLIGFIATHFAVQLEMNLRGLAEGIHQERPWPTYMPAFIFIILGGQWLLAVVFAVLTAKFFTRSPELRSSR